MATTVAEDGGKVRLAQFPRRNRETGVEEAIRIELADFQGREYLHLRLWYKARPNGPDDDGWRPSKIGVSVREHELDALAEAIEEARRLVHAEGRSTAPEPRPVTTSRPRPDRPSTGQRPHQSSQSSRSVPPWEGQAEDDLPY